MTNYSLMTQQELNNLKSVLLKKYSKYKSLGLKLDMSRGKPCKEQLDLSMNLFRQKDIVNQYETKDGIDCRNYGVLDGITEAKELFAEILEVLPEEIIIGGNSSLQMMYDSIMKAMVLGVYGSEKPWGKLPAVKFLCPSPGYDRHFAICEELGIEMITIDMNEDGPDMDTVEKYVSEDELVKGIWCVPKYSNPLGVTYSDKTVERLANMNTKAKDFRIFWDNAYAVHDLYDDSDNLKNILDSCNEAGNPERVYIFTSTSKITFPGSGLGIMASSKNNVQHLLKQISKQTIGPDKINQLHHILFLKSLENINKHMKRQADIIRPKFEKVLEIFEKELSGKEIAWWNKPKGGYFISLKTLNGCAIKVVEMASGAGIKFTDAGAAYPYRYNPHDNNIRIAPTFPSIGELEIAIEILCNCIEIVSINKFLQER
jgi:aspartate/methionine/tyrosine aminotransferase